jgi:hypothetical protein
MTVEGLKRRVARRFSVIGPNNGFTVKVNGQEILPEDRAYHNAIQYLWVYGSDHEFAKSCKNLERAYEDRLKDKTIPPGSDIAKAGISIRGWIGTVASPSQLKDEEGDNLNHLAIFMRGKMAQEDILGEFGQKEIYADYLIGELHCEELDLDDKDDIATSSRQSLKEDDPRFESLKKIVLQELRYVASKWSDWRRSDGAKTAAAVPAVAEWLGNLKGDTKKKAERWIGRLNTIRAPNESDKKELLKASILAFESYRRKEDLDRLDSIQDENLKEVLAIFKSIDDLELSYYGQIVEMRVKVINTLKEKLKKDDKELVLRDYIFDHLWLLDPSWERAKGTEYAETKVGEFLQGNTAGLSPDEKKGRIDIGYRTTSGKHVIIELKRSSVAVPIDDLTKQIRKYRDGVKKILDKTTFKEWPIEIICLLGTPPPEYKDATGTGPRGVADALKNVDARIVFYDDLLTNAERAYGDYLVEHKKVDKLYEVFKSIDNFASEPKS